MNYPDEIDDAVATELRAAAARHATSGAAIARKIGLPPLYVQRRLSGAASVSVADLILISDGIGCHALDVVAQVLNDRDRVRPAGRDMPAAQTTEAHMQKRGD